MKAQKSSDLPVAILCGGKGTRLGELTKDTPKSLMDVNGKPILDKACKLWKYDLEALSLETVQQFRRDSEGYTL